MNNQKSDEKILEVKNLQTWFWTDAGIVKAVDGVSFDLHKREMLAIVGESGSGKSVTNLSVIKLIQTPPGKIEGGEVLFNGEDLLKMSDARLREIRGDRIAMIFQDPMASLNPRKTIGDIIGEGLDIHHSCQNAGEREARIKEMLRKVGLDPEHHSRYPHQFSGGQRQRVGIARALMMNPKLIIADECISALDVSIQAQVVNLMKDIQEETGTAYLFIAHDLAMVKYISDRIGVLHLGHLLETGSKDEIFSRPIHPYTRSLLSAIPVPNPIVEKQRVAEVYDYKTSGIDYNKGTNHLVEGTHYVRCTDQEFEKWVGAASHTRLFDTNQLY